MIPPGRFLGNRRLPSDNEPVLGKHLHALLEAAAKQSTGVVCLHSTLDATGTTYVTAYASNDSVNEYSAVMLMPRDATLRNFSVQHYTAGTTANRVQYTIRLNGEDTSCVITIPGNDTAPRRSSVSIPIAQFDKLSIKVSRPDGTIATAPTNILLSYEIQ